MSDGGGGGWRTGQADSLQEGLKKMVHLSLERMLHDRVGSQEKDLLRSQLEAERDAHRLTRERVAAHHSELATQQQYVRDYEVRSLPLRGGRLTHAHPPVVLPLAHRLTLVLSSCAAKARQV